LITNARGPALRTMELEALQAVGRGATQFAMGSSVESRLLALGLIDKAREGYRLTAAGRGALQPGRRNQWY
jgi:hypothetical protein